jgi:hypothetical protein
VYTDRVLEDPDAFFAAAEQYARLGITELQFMPDRNPVEFATGLADEVVPRLA